MDSLLPDRPAVALVGVTARYPGRTALDRVDLEVRPGTVHGLLGLNGAGKTTLLRVLLGLVDPAEGEVALFGRTFATHGPATLDGVGGFVETPACWPYLTGRQALRLLARLDDDAVRTPDEALGAVGLLDRADSRVGGWSLGMRQRLGLAAALLRGDRLLVLDEPANGLDPAAARGLRALLARLADDGTTVLLSSHDMAEVEQLCATVTVLQQGRVVFDGALAALRAQAPPPPLTLSTSDDRAAAALALRAPGVSLAGSLPTGSGGLRLRADQPALDAFVLALGAAGVAVRALSAGQVPLADVVLGLASTG